MAVDGYASRMSKEPQTHAGSTERLEMANLNGGHTHEQDSSDDGGNESDEWDEAEGERALLRSERKPRRASIKASPEDNTRQFVYGILIETIPTLLFTTVGLTFTGELLERVADWRALKRVNELYILIPMLNNLKGNLEMNLSSRLSTSANIGELDVLSTRNALLLGNLSLLQVQALLVSAVAALLSFLLGLVISPTSESTPTPQISVSMLKRKLSIRKPPPKPEQPSGLREFGMVLSTAMASASISGLILGSFMCTLILICRRWNRNPDNITPPIASCLGDLLTLCIVGLVSSVLIRTIDTALPIVLIVLLVMGAACAIMLTLRNDHVRQLMFLGWTPLLGAMLISSGTGMVLDHFVNQYEGFGLLAIVLGGLPGSVGSVLVSRLSTSLHAAASNPFHAEGKPTHEPRTLATTATLFLVTLPVLGLFLAFLQVTGWTKLPFLFVAIFVVAFCCTVITSLAISHMLTQFLWRRDLDPDTYALPIQSSLVDLLGQLMLVACYEIAQALGADVKNKPIT